MQIPDDLENLALFSPVAYTNYRLTTVVLPIQDDPRSTATIHDSRLKTWVLEQVYKTKSTNQMEAMWQLQSWAKAEIKVIRLEKGRGEKGRYPRNNYI